MLALQEVAPSRPTQPHQLRTRPRTESRQPAPGHRVGVRQPQTPDAARQHLAKTLAGLVQRIAQRLLALTLGMFLNPLTGRPPRALVAYDGR